MTAAAAETGASAPGVGRRLACFLYEGLLLFGVVAIAGLVYSLIFREHDAVEGRVVMMAFLFLVMAAYFVYFWCQGGQTLAMKSWRLRLVTADGRALTWPRAFVRYLLCWVWVLPPLSFAHFAGVQSAWNALGLLTLWVLGYAALAWLHPQRQFWHDAACGTRLVHWHPPARPRS
jgi:uncharacterized RDD family membrane protein YckC